MKKYIMVELAPKFEVHEQDKYVYAYMRAEGGYGNECNIMTFPMNYEASVAVALAFMDEWHRQRPKWLSKDVLVLFYDDASDEASQADPKIGENYSQSVKEFLKWYYMGHDEIKDQDQVKYLLDDSKLIHGRCGYLRQGFPFIFRDYDFNKFNLHLDGVNGKLSDIDYYDNAMQTVS